MLNTHLIRRSILRWFLTCLLHRG